MNQALAMLVIQHLAFLEKKVAILWKNLKIDNFSYSIKKQSKQNKELKYRRKNIVCLPQCLLFLTSQVESVDSWITDI